MTSENHCVSDERQGAGRDRGDAVVDESRGRQPPPGKSTRTRGLKGRPPRARTAGSPGEDGERVRVIEVDTPGAPGDALAAASEPLYRRIAAEDTLASILAMRVTTRDVRAQQQRRRMLIEAFESVPEGDRAALQYRLRHLHKGDALAQSFHYRLSRSTRKLLVDVLDLAPVLYPTDADSVDMSAFLESVDAEDVVTLPERIVIDDAWRGEQAVSVSLVTPYGPPGDAGGVEARWTWRDRATDEVVATVTNAWEPATRDVPPLETVVRTSGVYEARLEILHRGLLVREIVRDVEAVDAGAEDLLDLLADGDIAARISKMTAEQLTTQAIAVRRRMAQLPPDAGPGTPDYELLRYTLNEMEVSATSGTRDGGRPSTTLPIDDAAPSVTYHAFFGIIEIKAADRAEVRARLEEAIITKGEPLVRLVLDVGHARSTPEADAIGLDAMVHAEFAILEEENEQFKSEFGETAKTIGYAMLAESERELLAAMDQYDLEYRIPGAGPGSHAPSPFAHADEDELKLMVAAAADLKAKHDVLVEAEKNGAANDAYHDTTPDDGTASDVDEFRSTEQLARDDYMRSRAIAIEEHPVLLAYLGEGQELGKAGDLGTKDAPAAAEAVGSTMTDKLLNIGKARAGIESGKLSVWKNPDLVALTRAQMKVAPDSMRARVVSDREGADESSWLDEMLMVVTLALGLLLAIPTGGGSVATAVAISAEIALLAADLYILGKELDQYHLGKAANNTDMSRSEALIAQEPSIAGVLIQIAGTALGAGGVISAVRRANGLRTAVREVGNLADPRVSERIHSLNALGAKYGDDALGDRLARETLEHLDDAGRMTRAGSGGADELADSAATLAQQNMARAARGELGQHAVVGYVRSEDAGYKLLRRLADGDESALAELGARMPAGHSPFDVEWGLARQWDGKLVIVHGSPGAVDWAHLPGLTAIQHTHPFRAIKGAAADQGGRAIDDLARGVDDYYKLFPSPSDAEYALRNGQRGHTVSTPFISVGGGRIANPGTGATGPGVDFVIEQVEYAGRWAHHTKVPVFRAKVVAKADGKPIWEGELWMMESGAGDIVQKAALPISADKLPLPDEAWRMTRAGDGPLEDEADVMTQYGIKNQKAAKAGQPAPYPDVDAATRSSMDELAAVRERGYPHGFESAEEFAEFGERVKSALGSHKIGSGTVAVHGSAMHRVDPQDIDIAVLVEKQEYDELVAVIEAETKHEAVRKKLGKEILKGKIASFYFPRVDGDQLVATLGDKRKIQISIVLRGSEFDIGPYMPL